MITLSIKLLSYFDCVENPKSHGFTKFVFFFFNLMANYPGMNSMRQFNHTAGVSCNVFFGVVNLMTSLLNIVAFVQFSNDKQVELNIESFD